MQEPLNWGKAPSLARSLWFPSSLSGQPPQPTGSTHSRQLGNPELQQGESASFLLHGGEPKNPRSHDLSKKLSPLWKQAVCAWIFQTF